MAWSLAQHYLIATALTDLTFSPRVAAWFATEPWDPDAPRPMDGERGVLYRIHKAKLESILARATELSSAMALAEGSPPAPAFFLVDIREIPAKFAKRPSAQQGASVYGFDQAHVIAAAFLGGAIDAFEFTHRSNVRLDVSREDVVPSEDPFLEKVARFHAFRGALATRAGELAAAEGAEPSALDRANTVFNMGLISAHEVKKVRLSERMVATAFDRVQKSGEIEFRYLMLVEDEQLKSVLCGVSAEPIKLAPGLTPEIMDAMGLGGFQALRLWLPDGSRPSGHGAWKTVDEFVESAAAVARRATGLSGPTT
jgi:hypothetical protein